MATGPTGERKMVDLYEDLTDNGKLDLRLVCVDRAQYFGVAQADAYWIAREGSFVGNYLKGLLAMSLPIPMVVSVGVLCGTFLGGAVSLAATVMGVIVGFFWEFVQRIADKKVYGGGPIEAWWRLVTQRGANAPMEPGTKTDVIHYLDDRIRDLLEAIVYTVPNLRVFFHNQFVVNGFDIPGDQLVILSLRMVAYVIPVALFACIVFRAREVAR